MPMMYDGAAPTPRQKAAAKKPTRLVPTKGKAPKAKSTNIGVGWRTRAADYRSPSELRAQREGRSRDYGRRAQTSASASARRKAAPKTKRTSGQKVLNAFRNPRRPRGDTA